MTLYFGSGFPLPPVLPFYTQNGEEVLADVVSALAGNARLMSEALGLACTTSPTRPCAPYPPQAWEPGHDHSGGTMGTPLQWTLWSAVWGTSADKVDANLYYGRAPRTLVTTAKDRGNIIHTMVKCMWVPGCPPGGAWETLRLQLGGVSVVPGGGGADVASDLRVRWTYDNDLEYDKTTELLGSATLTYTGLVYVKPGKRQHVRLRVEAIRKAADANVSLRWMTLSQVKIAP